MSAEIRKKKISAFFRKEYSRLLGYVQRMIDYAADLDAEDIIQDVMVNLIDRADPTLPIENLSAYIYRALKNRVVDIFRRRRRYLPLDAKISSDRSRSLIDILQDSGSDIAARLEQEELYHLLYAAIGSLDARDRAILAATEFEGYTFRQLSEDWGVPLGTLLARKSRALEKIRGVIDHALKSPKGE